MRTFLTNPRRINELLQKRFVFNGETAPEAITAASLTDLDDATLILRARETRRQLNDKVLIAEDIVRRLTNYTGEQNKSKELPLINELKTLLTTIEGSTDQNVKTQGESLRERGRAAVEDTLQRTLMFRPSPTAINNAIQNMKEGLNDVVNWGSGKFEQGFQKLFEGFQYLYGQISSLWPSKFPPLFGEAAPATPPPAPDAVRERAEAVTGLTGINLVPTAEAIAGKVCFKIGNGNDVYQMNYDGTLPQKKNGTNWEPVSGQPPVYPKKYLEKVKGDMDGIVTKVGPAATNDAFKANMARGLIELQQAETGSPKADIAKLINERWTPTEFEKTNAVTNFKDTITRILPRLKENRTGPESYDIPQDLTAALRAETMITTGPNFQAGKLTFQRTAMDGEIIYWRMNYDGTGVQKKIGDNGNFSAEMETQNVPDLGTRRYILLHNGTQRYESIPSLKIKLGGEDTLNNLSSALIQLQKKEIQDHPNNPIDVARVMNERWDQFVNTTGYGNDAANLKRLIFNTAGNSGQIITALRQIAGRETPPPTTPVSPPPAPGSTPTPTPGVTPPPAPNPNLGGGASRSF